MDCRDPLLTEERYDIVDARQAVLDVLAEPSDDGAVRITVEPSFEETAIADRGFEAYRSDDYHSTPRRCDSLHLIDDRLAVGWTDVLERIDRDRCTHALVAKREVGAVA